MSRLLIDSHYLGYQAAYAMGDTLSFQGSGTGVLFGYLLRIIQLAKSYNCTAVYTFWDGKKLKRKEMFPGYKATRHQNHTPEEQERLRDIWMQFEILRDRLLPEMGIPVFYDDEMEADDLIAAFISDTHPQLNREQLFVLSSDQDLYQLLTFNNVVIGSFGRKCKGREGPEKCMDKNGFIEKYGIHPSDWCKVKALSGCTSDEIPGIPGVGEKTAIKYLSGALKPEHKTFQSIVQNQALFQRNLALVTLPHPETSPLYVPEWKIDLDQCHAIFQEFNMQSMMEERQWMDWKCLAKGNWPYAGAGLTRILSSQVLNSL